MHRAFVGVVTKNTVDHNNLFPARLSDNDFGASGKEDTDLSVNHPFGLHGAFV